MIRQTILESIFGLDLFTLACTVVDSVGCSLRETERWGDRERERVSESRALSRLSAHKRSRAIGLQGDLLCLDVLGYRGFYGSSLSGCFPPRFTFSVYLPGLPTRVNSPAYLPDLLPQVYLPRSTSPGLPPQVYLLGLSFQVYLPGLAPQVYLPRSTSQGLPPQVYLPRSTSPIYFPGLPSQLISHGLPPRFYLPGSTCLLFPPNSGLFIDL